MGRTKLYQAPRSPLIQGHSRTERPLWGAWAIASAVGLIVPWVVFWLLPLDDVRNASFDAAAAAFPPWFEPFPLAHLAVLLGAIIGVLFARAWGSRSRWIFGAVFASAAWYLVVVLVG
mgnify:FL=1